jgi:hypothetical protein
LSQAAYCKRFQGQNYRLVKDSLKRVTTHDGFLEFANNSEKTSKKFLFDFFNNQTVQIFKKPSVHMQW